MANPGSPMMFCSVCGVEADEEKIKEPCSKGYDKISMQKLTVYEPSQIEKGDVVGLKQLTRRRN